MSASSNLFEQQTAQQLAELSQIVTEKWPLAVNAGHAHLKRMIDSYRALFDRDSESDGDGDENKKANLFYISQLPNLNTCNQAGTRLKETLNSFEKYINRMSTIERSLTALIEMKVKIFDSSIDLDEFKGLLSKLIDSFRAEFKLKEEIINNLLFQSRHDEKSRVCVLSLWIHQPYLSDFQIEKFCTLVKLLYNKF